MGRLAAVVAWAAAITAGAVALHYGRLTGTLARLAGWEPAHVVAHLFLYGALAALASWWLRGWSWKVFAAVAAVGFVQEAAQTRVFGIGMGRHEAYDFSIDLLGAAVALGVGRARRRRAQKNGAASPAANGG